MTIRRCERRIHGVAFARLVLTTAIPITAAFVSASPTFIDAVPLSATPQQTMRRPPPNGRGGEPQPTNVVFTGVPGAIEGTLADPLGGLMGGVSVRLTDALGTLVRTVRTSSGATFEFAGLPPGAYSIDLVESGFERTHVDVAIEEGERLTRAIVMRIAALEETLNITPTGPRTTPQPRTELDRFLATRNAPPAQAETSRCAAPAPCVTPARKVANRQPRYPSEVASAGIEGVVVLEARITREGDIDDVRPLVAEDDRLRDAVVTAVREWQFEPARLNGTTVDMPLSITVEFTLR